MKDFSRERRDFRRSHTLPNPEEYPQYLYYVLMLIELFNDSLFTLFLFNFISFDSWVLSVD
jgi:hypothetical protein